MERSRTFKLGKIEEGSYILPMSFLIGEGAPTVIQQPFTIKDLPLKWDIIWYFIKWFNIMIMITLLKLKIIVQLFKYISNLLVK